MPRSHLDVAGPSGAGASGGAAGEAAAEPAKERDRRGGDGGGVAAAGGCDGLYEAVVVGGSEELVDVLLGDDAGLFGMHGLTSLRCGAGTVTYASCSGLAVR